jgi:hypothetical protein
LNKESRKAKKVWSSSSWVGRGANNSLPVSYEMLHRTSDLDEFSGITLPEPLASQEGLSYTESVKARVFEHILMYFLSAVTS